MFKRLAMLWSLVRGDARLLWRALRHPEAPGWVKFSVLGLVVFVLSPAGTIPVLGLVDDLIFVPLAIRLILSLLPAQLLADIGGSRRHP